MAADRAVVAVLFPTDTLLEDLLEFAKANKKLDAVVVLNHHFSSAEQLWQLALADPKYAAKTAEESLPTPEEVRSLYRDAVPKAAEILEVVAGVWAARPQSVTVFMNEWAFPAVNCVIDKALFPDVEGFEFRVFKASFIATGDPDIGTCALNFSPDEEWFSKDGLGSFGKQYIEGLQKLKEEAATGCSPTAKKFDIGDFGLEKIGHSVLAALAMGGRAREDVLPGRSGAHWEVHALGFIPSDDNKSGYFYGERTSRDTDWGHTMAARRLFINSLQVACEGIATLVIHG